MPADSSTHSDPVESITLWLSAPPSKDTAGDIYLLTQHLVRFREAGVDESQFHRCIELLYNRALFLCGRLRRLLHTTNTVQAEAHSTYTPLLIGSLTLIAQEFERMLNAERNSSKPMQRPLFVANATYALHLMTEQYLISCMAGLEIHPEFWITAHRLYDLSRFQVENAPLQGEIASTALAEYKRLLTLSSMDGHTLSASEIDWVAQFISKSPVQIHIQKGRPNTLNGAWFWLDSARDAEPHACIRQAPPENADLVFFSTIALAHHAGELLSQHEQFELPALLPNSKYPGVQPAVLVERLRQKWIVPASREEERQNQQYQVDICVGLPAIWNLLMDPEQTETLTTRWNVRNESPGGYSIMYLQGLPAGISSGIPIILRRSPEDAWSLCIVRWVRRKVSDYVEMGLQVIARAPLPVRIGFRHEKQLLNALALPPHASLRQHQAVLAPVGTYSSRHFTLVAEGNNVYVSQGRLLSLDMQTSQVELFQFELNPYPK